MKYICCLLVIISCLFFPLLVCGEGEISIDAHCVCEAGDMSETCSFCEVGKECNCIDFCNNPLNVPSGYDIHGDIENLQGQIDNLKAQVKILQSERDILSFLINEVHKLNILYLQTQ